MGSNPTSTATTSTATDLHKHRPCRTAGACLRPPGLIYWSQFRVADGHTVGISCGCCAWSQRPRTGLNAGERKCARPRGVRATVQGWPGRSATGRRPAKLTDRITMSDREVLGERAPSRRSVRQDELSCRPSMTYRTGGYDALTGSVSSCNPGGTSGPGRQLRCRLHRRPASGESLYALPVTPLEQVLGSCLEALGAQHRKAERVGEPVGGVERGADRQRVLDLLA